VQKKKQNSANALQSVPSGWNKPETTQDRKLDLIDEAVASMAHSFKWINQRKLPFSQKTYQGLIHDCITCHHLNWSLTPEQRIFVLGVLRSRTSTVDLEVLLRSASKK
jgi:hypothetical protein